MTHRGLGGRLSGTAPWISPLESGKCYNTRWPVILTKASRAILSRKPEDEQSLKESKYKHSPGLISVKTLVKNSLSWSYCAATEQKKTGTLRSSVTKAQLPHLELSSATWKSGILGEMCYALIHNSQPVPAQCTDGLAEAKARIIAQNLLPRH